MGYKPRPLARTLQATIDSYTQLMREGAFDHTHRSSLSTLAAASRVLSRIGLLEPVKLGQRVAGRRVIAGV